MKRIVGLIIAWLIVAGLLVFAGVEPHPYRFYTLLRWICCTVFAYSAFAAHERKRVPWVWVFGVLAALYNPILPVELDRSTWIIINLLTVGAILIAIGFFCASETNQQAAPKEELRDGLTQAESDELAQLQSMPDTSSYDCLSEPEREQAEQKEMRKQELYGKRARALRPPIPRYVHVGLVIAALVCFYVSIEGTMSSMDFVGAALVALPFVVFPALQFSWERDECIFAWAIAFSLAIVLTRLWHIFRF